LFRRGKESILSFTELKAMEKKERKGEKRKKERRKREKKRRKLFIFFLFLSLFLYVCGGANYSIFVCL
jgi:cell division septal protein FtsQ